MDDPQLAEDLHLGALKGLQRINSVARCWKAVWNPIRQLAKSISQPIRVLDVACGSGDLLFKLCRLTSAANLPIQFTGLDVSPTAIEFAARQAKSQELPVEFIEGNAAQLTSGPQYDVVCCSLFMHHLPSAEAVELLGQMKASAQRMLLVQDLLRTQFGFWLAKIAPRLLTRSKIVHVDGVRSVRAAFSFEEVQKLAEAAMLENAEIRKLWPERFLLKWVSEATDGTATDGTATDGTATDGTATDGTATDGTATDDT